MKMHRSFLAVCVAATALGLGACQSSDKASASSSDAAMAVKADNTACPFSNQPVNPSISPIAYKGKNVGFCCAGCAGKFTKLSDAEKDAKIAAMK